MNNSEALLALADIVADLSRDLPPRARYQRVLEALMRSFPCDASALLQLEGETLVPRAVRGLNPDTMGRRFSLKEQPRLEEIVLSAAYRKQKELLEREKVIFKGGKVSLKEYQWDA